MDFGFWILDFGFWILDFGSWILDFGFWISLVFVLFVAAPNGAVWILDFGVWILDFGVWILDFGFWILVWMRPYPTSFGSCIRYFHVTPTRVGGFKASLKHPENLKQIEAIRTGMRHVSGLSIRLMPLSHFFAYVFRMALSWSIGATEQRWRLLLAKIRCHTALRKLRNFWANCFLLHSTLACLNNLIIFDSISHIVFRETEVLIEPVVERV